MAEIEPKLDEFDIACAELPASPGAMVVFGASGDLSQRKLIPALFNLHIRGLLSERFYLIGIGRSSFSDDDFRSVCLKSLSEIESDRSRKVQFLKKFHFLSGNYNDSALYERLKLKLAELDKQYNVPACHVFYLAVPSQLYADIADMLGSRGFAEQTDNLCTHRTRLVVEKPFGIDLASAIALNDRISRYFDESQIYRIDHYLGKETVQNILMLRFANTIFEPVWNRNYIDHIQITIAESVGIGTRAGFYDKTGALRDMFQNHLLSMLALVAMEPPANFSADCIRDEKVKLLRSLRLFSDPVVKDNFIRAQYAHGKADGNELPGYTEELNIPPDSRTETFVAGVLYIDNWRFKDVPFYVRTGKRLAAKVTEIAVTFKQVPHSLFASVGLDQLPRNVLVLKIQPDEGMSLSFQAKRPGSKTCMSTMHMDFAYNSLFGVDVPDAYQRLLLDVLSGDQTLFTRMDDVKLSWEILSPIMEYWKNENPPLYKYPAGAETFAQSDLIMFKDNRKWRPLGL